MFDIKKLVIVVLMTFFVSNYAMSQQVSSVKSDVVPIPTRSNDVKLDLDDKVWNRWETDNFVILSLDLNQGLYLYNNLENIKNWTFTRWGIDNIPFQKRVYKEGFPMEPECVLVCVPNEEYLKKLFRLEGDYSEVQKSGNMVRNICWISLDKKPSEIIPTAITTMCLNQLEKVTNKEFNFWIHRGVSRLNGTPDQIRETILFANRHVHKNKAMFFSESLFNMTKEEWLSLNEEEQKMFDAEALMMCLLIRKEFGQNNFLQFMYSENKQQDIQKNIKFKGYDELDATFKRYVLNLSEDVKTNKTPDSYLQINAVKE